MKRRLMTLAALAATVTLTAQQTLDVYSVYDVNHDTKVLVDDVTSVVNVTLANATAEDRTVVDAAMLNTLLLEIYQKLESIDSRLKALESNQCNCNGKGEGEGEETDGGTGEGADVGLGDETSEETNDSADENGIIANGHEYVDLGLKDSEGRAIYWATCNIGADKPEDAGLYFAWGETAGCGSDTGDGRKFDWSSYSLSNGSSTSMKVYCTNNIYGKVDGKKVLDPADDAAHVNWGGDWRMPTAAEQDQLRSKCTWTWDDTNNGYIVKGPNDKSIFLPAAGYRRDANFRYNGSNGYYWSSSLSANESDKANDLSFSSRDYDWSSHNRCDGQSVRAVCMSSE